MTRGGWIAVLAVGGFMLAVAALAAWIDLRP